jgi:hypothetical protein
MINLFTGVFGVVLVFFGLTEGKGSGWINIGEILAARSLGSGFSDYDWFTYHLSDIINLVY